MQLLFSWPIFSDEVILALSRTLIHSLWQGMLLAIVAGIIVFFTRRATAMLRYSLLVIALLAFVLGVGITFTAQLVQADVNPGKEVFAAVANEMPAPLVEQVVFGTDGSLIAKVSHFFNENAHWIVSAWLLIILLKCVQLTGGLYNVYQLKSRQTLPAGQDWDNRITDLCRQLQINKQVKLLQSGLAKVPAVIGFFKPVILFPLGMLSSLTPQEVEAILVHELAHIRRKDYLVNVLQHIVEIIFFFNPAVSWVSRLVRTERENCCDDIAVHHTSNKRNYISALIAFEEMDLNRVPSMAHAFAGEKNHLMNRVKRIIYNNNKTLNNMEKKFLAAGLIITSVFIFAFTPEKLQQEIKREEHKQPVASITQTNIGSSTIVVVNDTIPGNTDDETHMLNGTINSTVNGKKYKIVTRDNKVREIYVDEKKVPAEKMGEYKAITNKIVADAKRDMKSAEKDMEQAHKEMAQAQVEIEQAHKELALAQIEIEKAQQEMDKDMEAHNDELEHSKLEMEHTKEDMAKVKIEMEQAKKDMKHDMEQAKAEIEHAKKEIEQSKQEIAEAKIEMEQAKKEMAESKRIQQAVIADFIKEKLVSSKDELKSYELNNEVLIINGVKQPAAVHQKFKDKYVKTKNWSMMYND